MAKSKKSLKPVDTVIRLMKQGFSDGAISKHLIENNLATETKEASAVIEQAASILTAQHERNVSSIISLHRARYYKEINRLLAVEELDEKLIGITITPEQFQASRNKKIRAYEKALDTMRQHENLINVTSDSISVELNDDLQINVEASKPKFDASKLTFEEQVELYQLINKAKRNENSPISVIEAGRRNVNVVEEIVPGVVDEANISQIKAIQDASLPFDGKTHDPVSKLKENLRKIAARKFQEAGGKLTDEESTLLKD